ncbi:phosphate ABC transporter permease PtsA [Pseudonocardia sp. TMWB2A]
MTARRRKRHAAERRFRLFGLGAILVSALFLAFLLVTMTSNGIGGFQRSEMVVPMDFKALGLTISEDQIRSPDAAQALAAAGLEEAVNISAMQAVGPEGAAHLSQSAWTEVRDAVIAKPSLLHEKTSFDLSVSDDLAAATRGEGTQEMRALAGQLEQKGALSSNFDLGFLTRSDATDPGQVGIWGALKGSILTMLVTLLLAFPVGVLAAVYLEEYAAKNRWTDLIEVSINNLAAVPSIIFGLLGLAVFLTFMGLPRSAPLVGGMTLALMTMPVIVISGRNAIKAVPPSIRDAALAMGASPVQVVFQHVLPLALPGILTGTIIGMARALGETAPLLMIGMRAFVATPPDSLTAPSSVLPVQIFLWSDEVSRGFVERTSAAIIVLLLFLLVMNGLAIYLRNKFEQRW